jgi:hypothetical protein
MLIDIFSRIEGFFKRPESYTEVPPTCAMTDISIKIMVEVLKILGLATKEIKQRRPSEPVGIYESYLDLTFFREISEEASGQERYRGRSEEAGYAHAIGSSDGDCGSFKGHAQGGRQGDRAY